MILGLCGSSSTGKTTLLDALSSKQLFVQKFPNRTHVDARAIIRSMGHHSIDQMSKNDLQNFQRQFIREKIQSEDRLTDFCVDRTFVDIAAYWICRDAPRGEGQFTDDIVELCRSKAKDYSLHVYLPFGGVPFQSDGYRSEDLTSHQSVSNCILRLLREWNLNWIELDKSDLPWRVNQVLSAIQ